jgi:hypothetical protein
MCTGYKIQLDVYFGLVGLEKVLWCFVSTRDCTCTRCACVSVKQLRQIHAMCQMTDKKTDWFESV